MTEPPNPRAATASAAHEIEEVARKLLDVSQPPYSLGPEVAALRQIVCDRASFQILAERDIGHGETRLEAGLAVSPTQAAMCAEEVARTPVFIRGLHEAIRIHPRRAAGEKIHVLYAGCGPYALLALPQMSLFSPEEVSFTLLDLHPESLDSAKSLIEAFGFSDHVIRYEASDATTYQIPPGETPDIIVSETMNVALSNEPQVMIFRHLLVQAPEAILVPQFVSVRTCLVDQSREFNFSDGEGDHPKLQRDRVNLGTVFELSAETIRQWATRNGDQLPASTIEIPESFDSRYEARLLTEITTFGEHRLGDYDCSLTVPMPFPVTVPIRGGERFQFHYQLGNRPGLVCENLT